MESVEQMTSKNNLIIVGGGGFAREVIWLARECNDPWTIKGVLDDYQSSHDHAICGVPIIGKIDEWEKYSDEVFVVAIGSSRDRMAVVSRMSSKGKVKFASLIHRSVRMSEYVEFDEGCIVTAGCILTTQVKVGQHCIINLASTIGHDVRMGSYCTLAPQVAVSGNVSLGDGVELGTGAIIVQEISIAKGAFVGAGSVVTKDVPGNALVVGVPARRARTLDPF